MAELAQHPWYSVVGERGTRLPVCYPCAMERLRSVPSVGEVPIVFVPEEEIIRCFDCEMEYCVVEPPGPVWEDGDERVSRIYLPSRYFRSSEHSASC